jgi:hypothetical protein
MIYPRTRRQLLRDLTGAGVGAASVGLIGRDLCDDDEVADAAAPSCTLTPEVTEGPYYTGGTHGATLRPGRKRRLG